MTHSLTHPRPESINEAEYTSLSFSDHLGHIATVGTNISNHQNNARRRNIYKIKHSLVYDNVFLEKVRNEFPTWVDVKKNYSPVTWWENCVKPNVKRIALRREKEINILRRQELEALQLKEICVKPNVKELP